MYECVYIYVFYYILKSKICILKGQSNELNLADVQNFKIANFPIPKNYCNWNFFCSML